ncbi:MAG: membrane-binding protein [Alistipes sp.]|nr:membrane-binding protein [Alistipes sp.]
MRKSLLTLICLLCVINCIYAQDKIDTLYYTKEWKYAPNRAFADFYRIAYYPADSLQTKQFRDYYVSGELQSSGNFIKIDSLDDANTIFEGECINYFKNGRPEFVINYQQGVLNGAFCLYKEDGLIKQSGKYFNGELSGLYTEFLDNGAYLQVEYAEGKPLYDYYVVGDTEGNLTKFHLADNTPIWETPSITERKSDYKDGTPWQFFNKNGLIIALTNTIVKDYGKWHRIDIVISNNTIIPIEFDPVVNISASSTDVEGFVTGLEVWSSDEYLKKVNRSQTWAAVLMGVAEGMSTANAGYSTSTTNSYYSGSTYAYGSGGYGYGNYSGTSTSYTRTYDAGAAYQAQVLSQQRMADFSNAMAEEQEIKRLGYLKKNTIYPGETISGYVHIKRIRGESVQFVINIEGAEYVFDWNFGKR